MHHNVLTESLIAITDGAGLERVSLPEVLARLSDAAAIASFPELQPHQGHAWHAFLVQLAGLALHRAGRTAPPLEAGEWTALLRGLTPAARDDDAWHLVVEDWTRPALLQAPLPAATHAALKAVLRRPDELDVLVTAKNFDVKSARMDGAGPGHWLFALLSLQTMQGYSGRDNHGIVRMNGGFSSRPALGLVPGTGDGPGPRFRRDLAVLLAGRGRAEEVLRGPVALVWLEPWDGAGSLPLERLHPWFIEICRRVRLVGEGEGLVAQSGPSKAPRVDGKAQLGVVGDPWTPIQVKGAEQPKALTVGDDGFAYGRLQEILFDRAYRLPPMLGPHRGIDGAAVAVLARALVRGQGKTAGYHERLLPIPGEVLPWLAGERDRVATLAKQRVEDVRTTRKMLYSTLIALHAGNTDKAADADRDWADRWSRELDRPGSRVDEEFFERLWPEVLAADPDPEHRAWLAFLRAEAQAVFARAAAAAPARSGRGYRARAVAETLFEALPRKIFPTLFPPKEAPEDELHPA